MSRSILVPEADAIAATLISSVPHFGHLREARLLFVSSQRRS